MVTEVQLRQHLALAMEPLGVGLGMSVRIALWGLEGSFLP